MPILIAALSGRALAATARRVGAEIVVADFFGDRDTRRLAPWRRLPGDLTSGIDRSRLRLMARECGPLAGIVYGAGFEHSPALLGELAALAPLIGNTPETVRATKDPFGFAALLSRLGLSHPAVFDAPPSAGTFLSKRCGGAGGTHIRLVKGQPVAASNRYYQTMAAGQPVSALFVANGRTARVVGFSRQWTAPAPRAPFRYGGCVGPIAVPPSLAGVIADACNALTASLGLVGLNSLDMLIEDHDFTIVEVNPRPGATLDIFDAIAPGTRLWDWHLQGAHGSLPSTIPTRQGIARAAAILYAPKSVTVPPTMRWARWVADIPRPCAILPAGAPICTILADGDDAATAEALVRARSATVRHRLFPPRRLSALGDERQEQHAAS